MGEGGWFCHAFCSPGRAPGLPERIWPQDVSAEGNSAAMIPGRATFVPCVLFAGQGARVARERPGARFRARCDTGNPQFGGAGRVLPRAFCAPGRTPRPLERNSAPVGMRMGASLYPMAIRAARRTRRTVEHTTIKSRGSHNLGASLSLTKSLLQDGLPEPRASTSSGPFVVHTCHPLSTAIY